MDKKSLCFRVIFVALGVSIYILHLKWSRDQLVSGGPGTHMYQSTGIIIDVSDEDQIITVELDPIESEYSSVLSNVMQLDCSKAQHKDDVQIGDMIIFYYFKWDVENTTTKVQYVYLEKTIPDRF